jgi:hypothetical protein
MFVFFVHTLEERDLVSTIHQHLVKNDIAVWMDSAASLEPIEVQIKRWFEEAGLIVILATADFFSSSYCKLGWQIAKLVRTPKLVLSFDGVIFDEKTFGVTVVTVPSRNDAPKVVLDFILQAERKRVFISYSRKNETEARQVAELLSMSLSEHFIDRSGLVPGIRFPDQIKSAIDNCDVFLLLWSAFAAQSEWVTTEWNYALANNKTIMPILLDRTQLPSRIADIHGFEGTADSNFFKQFNIPTR